MAKHAKYKRRGQSIHVKSNRGRKANAKTRVIIKLGALRRLLRAARNGKRAQVKLRRAR